MDGIRCAAFLVLGSGRMRGVGRWGLGLCFADDEPSGFCLESW